MESQKTEETLRNHGFFFAFLLKLHGQENYVKTIERALSKEMSFISSPARLTTGAGEEIKGREGTSYFLFPEKKESHREQGQYKESDKKEHHQSAQKRRSGITEEKSQPEIGE